MGYEIEDATSTIKISLKFANEVANILQKYSAVYSTDDLVHLFLKARYESYINIETQEIFVTNIIHQFKWHFDEEKLWKDLAPFINTNSYISWYGEDGDIWRYVFVDKGIIIEYARDILYMYRYEIIQILKKDDTQYTKDFIKKLEWSI